ncbi:hypothetical protein K1X76_02825 [bacterium]|nr:hypothetical protein [bacterium]
MIDLMKRATLLLENGIYEQVKSLSRKKGLSIKEVINDLLRLGLNISRENNSKKIKVKIPVFHNMKPLPGFDVSDKSTWDFLERKL